MFCYQSSSHRLVRFVRKEPHHHLMQGEVLLCLCWPIFSVVWNKIVPLPRCMQVCDKENKPNGNFHLKRPKSVSWFQLLLKPLQTGASGREKRMVELQLTLWDAVSSLALLCTKTQWENVNHIAVITLKAKTEERTVDGS